MTSDDSLLHVHSFFADLAEDGERRSDQQVGRVNGIGAAAVVMAAAPILLAIAWWVLA